MALATLMLPREVTIIPQYLMFRQMGWIDTLLPLIVPFWFASGAGAFTIFLMRQFIMTIPYEYDEAAKIDGASSWWVLVRVILPLAKPGLLTTAMFGFLLAWDEFLYSLIFTSTTNAKTIPVAIAEFTGKYSSDFGLVAAGGVLASLPPLLLALLFQRYIVGGLTSGAVKG
jgi:multiple sugar transport system permease protein